MATCPLTSTPSPSPFCPHYLRKFPSLPLLSFPRSSLNPFPATQTAAFLQTRRSSNRSYATLKAQTFDFKGEEDEEEEEDERAVSIFDDEEGEADEFDEDDSLSPFDMDFMGVEKEMPPCPPGLRKYESMIVLRPDLSEDERLAFIQKYEELLVSGGGMYVEVFNKGVVPLSYNIKKKDKDGVTNNYLDGIYLLFTYYTKPESMSILDETLRKDDDVIRSTNFNVTNKKYNY